MTVREISRDLGLELLAGSMDTEITGGYTSDLLSDVMAHAEEGDALITIQAHTNAVAVASHADLPVVIICNGRPVPEEMLAAAQEHSVTVCRTALDQFEVSGKLYALL